MIMHPYLPELNGEDLTGYQDKAGNHLFVEMVNEVEKNDSGFVEYYWQYKDDPSRIVKKLSYVEEFTRGNWVIGTGIYVDDVDTAIAAVQRNLIYVSVAIFVAVALLLFYSSRYSLKIERRREAAEKKLKESHEKYRFLVEASTEGLLMTIGGKTTYANKPLADMLGYGPDEFQDMEIGRLLSPEGTDKLALDKLVAGVAEGVPKDFEARFLAKDASPIEALVTATPIWLAGRQGSVLLVKSLASQKSMQTALEDTRKQFKTMSDALTLGVFRSTWGKKASLLEVNPAMRTILGLPVAADLTGSDWLDRIVDPDQRAALVAHSDP